MATLPDGYYKITILPIAIGATHQTFYLVLKLFSPTLRPELNLYLLR
jgi:hypothetical protein